MIVCATLLACIIHESWGFVNMHPQQIESLCCGFRQGALHPSFDNLRIPSGVEGLKASPERRPEEAVVEVLRQAQDPERSRRARRVDFHGAGRDP